MDPPTKIVSDLLRDAGRGDGQAVGKLLDLHRGELVEAVRRRLDRAIAQRVDASDIVQDVLLEASQRLPDYLSNPSMPFGLWLRQLARDRIIDMHRRHRRAERRSVDRERPLAAPSALDSSSAGLLAGLCDPDLTPAANAIRHEFQTRFLDALAELEQDDRDILTLRHFEQMSNSEVAEALNLSQPAAGMRYLRALRRVRSILAKDGANESQGG